MRDGFGKAAFDVAAGGFETSPRAGECWVDQASTLRTRAPIEIGSEADATGGPMDRRISQILGGIARSPGGVFGKDEQRDRQESENVIKCVLCA